MSNKRINRKQDFLKNIQNGSPEQKMRMTWFLVVIFMIGISFLFLQGIKRNFARMGNYRVDTSSLPSFPEGGNIDLSGALRESGEELDEILAEDDAKWQLVGEKYIQEKKILDAESFLSLKFVSVKKENDTILMKYEEYYKDIPILGSGLTLSANADGGSVAESKNTLVTGIDLVVDPEVTLKAAGEAALKEIGDDSYVFKEGSLVIVHYEGDFYLAWKTIIGSDVRESTKEILIGARRGTVIPLDPTTLEESKTQNQISNIVE